MGRNYLIILPDRPCEGEAWRSDIVRIARETSLTVAIGTPWLSVVSGGPAILLEGGRGVILGELIRKGGVGPVNELAAQDMRALAQTGFAHLLRQFWGSYLAVTRSDEGTTKVLRAPLGDLPVYIWRSPRGLLIASDIELLVRFGGYRPTIDWIGVAEHLAAADTRRPRTCLLDVTELAGGTEGRWREGQWQVNAVWSPWEAVSRSPVTIDARTAADHIGAVTRQAVTARTSSYRQLLVLLSGGLDSSVVAAVIAQSARSVRALTLVTRAVAGDERRYARAVADALEIPLIAVERDTATIDITRSLAAGLPRPIERSFAQATHAAVQAIVDDADLRAVVNGGGGDNVFCSLQSVAPVVDRLVTSGFNGDFWMTASQVAMIARTSVFRVVWNAITRAVGGPRASRLHGNDLFLMPKAVAMATAAPEHPWFQAPKEALPGSAAHIALITAAQSVVESPDPRLAVPWIAPLISQPVVEACVSIPSWHWFDRGCNRAAARHAFADLLPAEIAWRRSKGAMDSFVIEIFEANRRLLAEMLLEGLLVSQGLIDRAKVRDALNEPTPTRGLGYGRIMQFADVEAWARSWVG